ncbi:MAG: hypothetical protein ABIF09_10210, partial [Gemmatimonadota bacterium]
MLGIRPKKRWGRWAFAIAAVLVAASYGVFQWRPWGGPSLDPAAFIPVSTQTPQPTEASLNPMDGGAPAVAGLYPAQDSVLVGAVGSLVTLSVRALGPGGAPLTDTLVLFRVVEGNGILETEEAETDDEGVAQANLRLPNRPGEVIVRAQLSASDTVGTVFAVT